MSFSSHFLPTRLGAVAAALSLCLVPVFANAAVDRESLAALEARMADIQAQLDARTAKIERLRTASEEVGIRIAEVEARIDALERRTIRLEKRAVARADALYRAGGSGLMEVLLGADDLGELATRAEILSRVSLDDARVFVRLASARAESRRLSAELSQRRAELSDSIEAVEIESDRLQEQFATISDEYERLQERLAAARARARRARRARAAAAARAASADEEPPAGANDGAGGRGMACPVAGPVSFVDSWGAPRDGHTHQGVDMMAASGTPIVAIVSGSITLSDFGGSAGYWLILSGDDGNSYWYMHNRANLVTGGPVSVGQRIASVGDTGNAAGTPHLHFEYHPGGGDAVNPYPLVASIC